MNNKLCVLRACTGGNNTCTGTHCVLATSFNNANQSHQGRMNVKPQDFGAPHWPPVYTRITTYSVDTVRDELELLKGQVSIYRVNSSLDASKAQGGRTTKAFYVILAYFVILPSAITLHLFGNPGKSNAYYFSFKI